MQERELEHIHMGKKNLKSFWREQINISLKEMTIGLNVDFSSAQIHVKIYMNIVDVLKEKISTLRHTQFHTQLNYHSEVEKNKNVI